MFDTKRYDINKFYVGELYLSYEFGNLLLPNPYPKESNEKRREIDNTILNGALSLESSPSRFIDWENRRSYVGVLSIFYRDTDGYICLHNGKKYTTEGFDFCKNLKPLSNVLPTIGFKQPKELSLIESMDLFERLFTIKFPGLSNFMYDKEVHNIRDFFVGNLNLYCNSDEYDVNQKDKNVCANVIEKRLLFKSDATINAFFGWNSSVEPNKCLDYIKFKTFFIKLENGQYYNLHNFTIYPKVTSLNIAHEKCSLGENYCENLQPFKEILSNNEIELKKSQITIPKALKLYRKVK